MLNLTEEKMVPAIVKQFEAEAAPLLSEAREGVLAGTSRSELSFFVVMILLLSIMFMSGCASYDKTYRDGFCDGLDLATDQAMYFNSRWPAEKSSKILDEARQVYVKDRCIGRP